MSKIRKGEIQKEQEQKEQDLNLIKHRIQWYLAEAIGEEINISEEELHRLAFERYALGPVTTNFCQTQINDLWDKVELAQEIFPELRTDPEELVDTIEIAAGQLFERYQFLAGEWALGILETLVHEKKGRSRD